MYFKICFFTNSWKYWCLLAVEKSKEQTNNLGKNIQANNENNQEKYPKSQQ